MSNKRTPFTPESPPVSAATLRSTRQAAALSMPVAAFLVQVSQATWESWEYGRNPMPEAAWRLFKIIVADRAVSTIKTTKIVMNSRSTATAEKISAKIRHDIAWSALIQLS